MRLTFLGVRGSTSAPGPEFVRYGGNTSCIAVSEYADAAPTLLLDVGTGLRSLTGLLAGEPYRGSALVSHLHWDHVQGLPFTLAVDRDDARLDLFVPAQEGRSGLELLSQSMSPPAFPITPDQLHGTWSFTAVEPGSFEADGFTVTAFEVSHKGGRTYGYRVDLDGASLAYIPDHSPAAGVSAEAAAVLEGVDALIHDAQFLEHERAIADLFGHATIDDAIELAESVHAGMLVLFHHGPGRTDEALDRMRDDFRASMRLHWAAEGDVLDVASARSVEGSRD